jgi:hypothetical protein
MPGAAAIRPAAMPQLLNETVINQRRHVVEFGAGGAKRAAVAQNALRRRISPPPQVAFQANRFRLQQPLRGGVL